MYCRPKDVAAVLGRAETEAPISWLERLLKFSRMRSCGSRSRIFMGQDRCQTHYLAALGSSGAVSRRSWIKSLLRSKRNAVTSSNPPSILNSKV